jgi:hypothetical protein
VQRRRSPCSRAFEGDVEAAIQQNLQSGDIPALSCQLSARRSCSLRPRPSLVEPEGLIISGKDGFRRLSVRVN